jgi:1,4-dihydroxy-2-naphthoate octaprenyltransferase
MLLEDIMEENKLSLWISAARPRTLPASVSPVIIAAALAYKDGFTHFPIFFACFGVALFAQIASNMANDYFDGKRGVDTRTRVGPARLVALGAVKPAHMLAAALAALVITALFGSYIAYERGVWLFLVGVLICAAALAYSGGPYPLAYHGLGDICVVIFYGIIPVIFTYYAITADISLQAALISIAMGLITDNILLVNNYRDYDEDAAGGKNTSVVVHGRDFGAALFLANILGAFVIAFAALRQFSAWFIILYIILFAAVLSTWRKLTRSEGRELNILLGRTGLNVFFFAALLSLGTILLP